MSIELRKKILEELEMELLKTKGEASDKAIILVGAFYNSLSQQLSEVIDGVDEVSAPFIVAALENYASSIRNLFPDCSKVVEWVKQLPSIQISKEKRK